jgi:biofilm PGA synthesis N-glycosyltransferase PgaC
MNTAGVFWTATFVIFYVYAGYPLLLWAWVRVFPRPHRKAATPRDGSWPSLSIVVAARNEAARLPARIGNLLELRYPGRKQIIVVSDGSTDDTVQVVGEYLAERSVPPAAVQVLEVPAGGKPRALNAGVAAATGEILVFADARQRFALDALLHLVANFADERVGGATGELLLDCEGPARTESTIGDGVGLYWKYEKWLRRNESAVWSTLGATGAIYALRRRLWTPLPPDTLLDDVLAPMRAVLQGYRIVFEERAAAFDHASADAAAESRRKTRTLAGNYQILGQEPRILVPFANPVWLQYTSHKLGRLLVPWALLLAFATSAALARSHWFYTAALTVQVVFYALAAYGAYLEHRNRLRPAEFERMSVPLRKGAR